MDALTRLRELLLEELSVQTDQAEGQCRAVAERRTDADTAVGQFEVDWELAEVIEEWSEEAIEDSEHAPAVRAAVGGPRVAVSELEE